MTFRGWHLWFWVKYLNNFEMDHHTAIHLPRRPSFLIFLCPLTVPLPVHLFFLFATLLSQSHLFTDDVNVTKLPVENLRVGRKNCIFTFSYNSINTVFLINVLLTDWAEVTKKYPKPNGTTTARMNRSLLVCLCWPKVLVKQCVTPGLHQRKLAMLQSIFFISCFLHPPPHSPCTQISG